MRRKMSRLTTLGRATAVAFVITLGISSTSAMAATTTTMKLTVAATGANVMAGKGSPTGSASGTFTTNLKKKTICYSIKEKSVSGIQAVHIHKGASGVEGNVVITLDAKKFNKPGSACVKSTTAVLGDIGMNPDKYYFNVHTKKFPNGAVRGQLAMNM